MRGMNMRRWAWLAGAVAVVGLVYWALFTGQGSYRVSDTPDYGEIDRFVQDEMDGSNIPGIAIAIVEDGEIVHARGFGNDGHGNAITPATPFWVGSNGKSMTALAARQLAEAGKLDLDAPVQRYLPTFHVADAEASSKITVRHLMNQTSGLSRADGVKPVAEAKEQTLEEAVADMATLKLNRPVGETYEYLDLNFVVLGLVVQNVSGRSWAEYVHTEIFERAGMYDTFTSKEAAEAAGLTAVHNFWFGFPIEADGKHLEGLAPSGYVYSTATDMGRYLSMYLEGGQGQNGRVLSQAGIDAMWEPATNETTRPLQSHSFTFRYGEGWFVGPFGAAEDARWHLGNLPHFTAWMVALPETDQGVVVLVNAGSQFEIAGMNAVMSRLPIGVVNMLRGEAPPTGPGMTRLYVLFNAIVIAIVGVQLWSFLNVARGKAALADGTGRRWLRAFVPLIWECGGAMLLLVALPSALALTWPTAIQSIPDLAVVVIAVAILWIITGAARVARLVQALPADNPRANSKDEKSMPARGMQ